MTSHPLDRWLGPGLGTFFRLSLVLSIAVGAVLGALDSGLRVPTSPLGIVSFEIAGSSAQAVIDGWSEAQRRDAILLQGIDYLFLVAYSSALASAALLLGRRLRPGRLAALAPAVAWAGLLAGASDAVENTPMTLALRSGVADPLGATVSLVFAGLKFVLLVVGFLYVMAAQVSVRLGRPTGHRDA